MINLSLTPVIKEWLDTERGSRDLMKGATLILQITHNKILFANLTRNISARALDIEYHLKKIYSLRLADITHEQVASMMVEVESIAKSRYLANGVAESTRSVWQKGKRADHDLLPESIQALYVENADILRRMREAHTKIRLISPENSSCPDSDRYPLAKYLIEMDKRYRDNWNVYDHYIRGDAPGATVKAVDPRSASSNAEKLCHILIGKYAKRKDDNLKKRIMEAYSKVVSPLESLRSKIKSFSLEE